MKTIILISAVKMSSGDADCTTVVRTPSSNCLCSRAFSEAVPIFTGFYGSAVFFFLCDVKGERMHCDRKTVFCFSKFIIKSNTRDATGERPRTENCVCE